MKNISGRMKIGAVAATLLIVLAGCGGAATGKNNKTTKNGNTRAASQVLTLNYFVGVNGQLAGSLDPAQLTSVEDADTVQLVQAGMVTIGTDNKVQNDLASKVKVSANKKVFTFTIRKGAMFSNGDPVTAQDFVWTLDRALSKKTASPVAYYDSLIQGYAAYHAGTSSHLAGVKALNSHTLQITISKAAPYFLKAFSYPNNNVLDPKVMKGHNSTATNNYLTNNCKANIGAGPFVFVCKGNGGGNGFYKGGTTPSYTLKPNPKYYGPKATVTLKIPAIKTDETGYSRYLAGSLDTVAIPTDHLAQWAKSGSPQYHTSAAATIDYVSLNTKMAPFTNKDCRLAVAYALNRQALAHVLHGAVKPDYAIVPQGFDAYFSGHPGVPYFNLGKAKHLAKAGHCGATHVTVKYNTGTTDNDNLFSAIVAMMNNAGFKAKVDPITVNDWITVVSSPMSKTNTQATRNGWQQDYPDPQDFISLLFRCGNSYDIGQWCNTQFEHLVDKADVNFNNMQRIQQYVQAEKIALNNGIPVMVDQGVHHDLIKTYVHGLIPSVAYFDLKPKNLDWSKVYISKH
ncbi:MAG: peptide ABC transporter substrate-binding protein [Chloroflexota bacterium]